MVMELIGLVMDLRLTLPSHSSLHDCFKSFRKKSQAQRILGHKKYSCPSRVLLAREQAL